MILFQPEFRNLILAGWKTQTRRMGKRRWRVGSIHQCYTKPPFSRGGAKPFAKVRIVDVRREFLFSVSENDALAEGYEDRQAFIDAFCKINERHRAEPVCNPLVWVVEFRVVPDDQ